MSQMMEMIQQCPGCIKKVRQPKEPLLTTPLPDDTEGLIETEGGPTSGHVRSSAETPRSYIVETPSGSIQRNRHHLKPIPSHTSQQSASGHSEPEQPNVIMTRSRTGTEITPPERLY
jgi:hypothetical protein